MVPFISLITTFKNKNEERHEFEAQDANGRAIYVEERQLFMLRSTTAWVPVPALAAGRWKTISSSLGRKGCTFHSLTSGRGRRSDLPNMVPQLCLMYL